MRSKAASSSVSAWLEANIPRAWRRPRRLVLVGALLAAIALIIATRPGATTMPPRHPAPGTTVFQAGQRVVLRFVHSAGRVHVTAGPDGQVSITENRSGITDAIHTSYRQQGDLITVTVSIDQGLTLATWVDFDVKVPRGTSAKVAVAAGVLEGALLPRGVVIRDTNRTELAGQLARRIAPPTLRSAHHTRRACGQLNA